MKLQYKLGIMALGLIAFTSCEKNDPIANHVLVGQRVPTCYWEVGSTTCKAGGYSHSKANIILKMVTLLLTVKCGIT